uniref:Uncharacterized protein n=1 Tax=Cannabis sativa TaxID=3483 RepID=A0A803NSG8_CANSA
MLKVWLNWQVQSDTLQGLLKCIRKSKDSKFRKGVKMAAVVALAYAIWRARNDLFWNATSHHAADLVKQVKWAVQNRTLYLLPKKVKKKDLDWFQNL